MISTSFRVAFSFALYIEVNFARVSSHVSDFITRNKFLTAKFLNRVIGTINSAKPFLNFIDVISIWFQNSKLD